MSNFFVTRTDNKHWAWVMDDRDLVEEKMNAKSLAKAHEMGIEIDGVKFGDKGTIEVTEQFRPTGLVCRKARLLKGTIVAVNNINEIVCICCKDEYEGLRVSDYGLSLGAYSVKIGYANKFIFDDNLESVDKNAFGHLKETGISPYVLVTDVYNPDLLAQIYDALYDVCDVRNVVSDSDIDRSEAYWYRGVILNKIKLRDENGWYRMIDPVDKKVWDILGDYMLNGVPDDVDMLKVSGIAESLEEENYVRMMVYYDNKAARPITPRLFKLFSKAAVYDDGDISRERLEAFRAALLFLNFSVGRRFYSQDLYYKVMDWFKLFQLGREYW